MDAVHRGPGVGPSGGVRWTRCRKEGGASASSVGGYLLLASFALICFTSCLLRLVIEGDPTVENLVQYYINLYRVFFFVPDNNFFRRFARWSYQPRPKFEIISNLILC